MKFSITRTYRAAQSLRRGLCKLRLIAESALLNSGASYTLSIAMVV